MRGTYKEPLTSTVSLVFSQFSFVCDTVHCTELKMDIPCTSVLFTDYALAIYSVLTIYSVVNTSVYSVVTNTICSVVTNTIYSEM